jgi:Protein of unknown function (DUF429)
VQWGISQRTGVWDPGTYKGSSPAASARRVRIIDVIAGAAPWLEINEKVRVVCADTDDCVDALICALVARACEMGPRPRGYGPDGRQDRGVELGVCQWETPDAFDTSPVESVLRRVASVDCQTDRRYRMSNPRATPATTRPGESAVAAAWPEVAAPRSAAANPARTLVITATMPAIDR